MAHLGPYETTVEAVTWERIYLRGLRRNGYLVHRRVLNSREYGSRERLPVRAEDIPLDSRYYPARNQG
jgi:hypothetical protein